MNTILKKISIVWIIFTLFFSIPAGFSATKAKPKKVTDANSVLQQGREAFLNYNFEEAADHYDTYRSLKTKAKQPFDENFEVWEAQLDVALNAFDKVQKIVVVDSITVPASSFYKSYKLAQSAGEIAPSNTFKLKGVANSGEIGFLNEWKDYLITVSPNEDGDLRLIENRKLLDGSWESHEILEGNFEKSGDYAFPFMSGDGQTLYFANNGDESMGGFDLFVAQKEPLTDVVLQPLNLGMPFNSPYDDFMMAIDEENGLGWWATNRNSEDGSEITIYVYRLDAVRKNYPSDTPDLVKFARLDDYKATQEND